MASTYSTSLKLQLIGNGDQSGVWGSTTNTNLNLVEQAVAGVVTITMLNADYTLSNLNGVSDESRNMVIVAGGTNSDVRKIVAPLVEKFYVVSNQTIGGYAITIGGATGSTISIPFGTTGQVYCDGTNFYSAQTTSAGSFTVNGSLVASGTSTFNGNVATAAGSVLVVAGPMAVANTAAFAGTTTAPTVTSSDNSANVATTAYVRNVVGTPGTMSQQNANAVAITGGTITGLSNLECSGNITAGGRVIGTSPGGGSSGGLTTKADTGNSAAYIQFTNNAGSAQWASISADTNNLYLNASGGGSFVDAGGSIHTVSLVASSAITYAGGYGVAPQPNGGGALGQWQVLPWYGPQPAGQVTLPAGGTWAWFFSNRGAGYAGINAGGTVVLVLDMNNAFGFCWRIT